ncbi:hypothetical protein RHSP_37267 [Rhizobium freirei PRF 81]|uniref:Uncharacterized protein n=1 Tax=Rhizobium freirei PRF 81 TaxID=363754 RepID=N6UAU0_9HYPH|nr:hypothetical protein RHSP_37267 [Rhizobium freirei PRF 81]
MRKAQAPPYPASSTRQHRRARTPSERKRRHSPTRGVSACAVRRASISILAMIGDHHGFESQSLRLAHALRLRLQLAAGGENIPPARRADRRGVTGRIDEIGELLDLLPVRTLVVRAGPGVEGDEVDLGRNAFQELDQPLGVLEAVVDALQHHIFEGDAARIRETGIGAAGVHQLLQRIFLVDRHEHVAQIVTHRMQRDRQHDANLIAGAIDFRHDAGGRKRDAALRQGQAVAVGGDKQGRLDAVEIIERLAHAHHDDVADLASLSRHDGALRRFAIREITEPIARQQQLRQDLFCRQIAHQPLRAGMTEGTGERAADLARNAKRASALFRNIDGLDLDRTASAARREAQQPFAGAVVGDLLLDDLRTSDGEMRLQHLAHVLRDIHHGIEIGDAAHIDPVPELADTHLDLLVGDALLLESGAHFLARQADQRRFRRKLDRLRYGHRLKLGGGHDISGGHGIIPTVHIGDAAKADESRGCGQGTEI